MDTLRVLIVENDRPSLDLMTDVFSSFKAKIVPVTDGNEAAALVNHTKFDGIFLDADIPEIRGLELTERVRTSLRNKSTPVIVVTKQNNPQEMRNAFEKGANFYLQKPVDRRRLINLFRTVRGTMIQNRRRFTRVPLRADVTCITHNKTLKVTSWNLSVGGIQIETADLMIGEEVQLSFHLPDSHEMVEISGVVAWARENRCGIQFRTAISHRRAISQFIDRTELHA